jgi:hypothetical protein
MIKRKFDFPTHSVTGKLLSTGLFRETTNSPDEAIFTLNARDHGKQPSLYLIYTSYDDPTEYQFAMEVFGQWRIWQRIADNPKIKPYVDSWREELEAKLRSEGIVKLREQAKNGNATAARWISEAGWKPKKRGPKPPEKAKEAERVQNGVKEHLKEHYNRLQRTK